MVYTFSVFFLVLFSVGGSKQYLESDVLDSILFGYNKYAYPGTSANQKVNVTHSIAVLGIEEFNYPKLVLDTWIVMGWTDQRLVWEGQSPSIRLPQSAIWKPDIILYRGSLVYRHPEVTRVMVDRNGHAVLVSMARLETHNCKVSKTRTINCSFKFGSWTYSADYINLILETNEGEMSEYENSGNFEVVNSTVVKEDKTYACCPEIYSHILYNFEINYR